MSLAKDLEYTEELSEVWKHLINLVFNTLDSSVGAGFTNNI